MSKDDPKAPFNKDDIDDIFELVDNEPPQSLSMAVEAEDDAAADGDQETIELAADSSLADALDPDIFGSADEVVLSADDDEFTPAAVALNKEEFESAVIPDAVPEHAVGKQHRGVVGVLLAIVRIPENAIKIVFRATPFYRLLSKSRRYRHFERDNVVSPALGSMPTSVSGRVGKFVVNNVLLTSCLVAGIVFAGNFALTEVAEVNALRQLLGLQQIDDGSSTMAEARQTRSLARVSSRRREDVIRDLDHCSVTSSAREQILASVGADGRLSSAEIQKSFGAMKRFRETFATKGIADEFEKARKRRALISQVLLPHLDKVDASARQIAQRIDTLKKQAASTEKKLSTLDARAQRKTVVDVNAQIKLRDDLAVIESQLEEAPSDEDVALLFDVMQHVRDTLAGGSAEPFNLAETDSLRTPEWVHNIALVTDDELRYGLEMLVDERIAYGEKQLLLGGWPVVTYYFNVITLSTNHIIRAIDGIDAKPKQAMRQLDRLQLTMNELIDEQFKLSDGITWIDYRGCLNASQVIADSDASGN